MATLKIGAISDIHGNIINTIEKCDIFVIAGDISPLYIQFKMPAMKEWMLNEFATWVKNIPADKVILVAGNHDAWLERVSEYDMFEVQKATNFKLIYLKNEAWTYKTDEGDWHFFGTPYCHQFGTWPFMRDERTLETHFKEIPDVVDVIISHDPPYGIGNTDVIQEGFRYYTKQPKHLGNNELAKRLFNVDYKLLICGHIHSGCHEIDDKCVNVSLLNEEYEVWYDPFYTTLEK
jgi:Icc-related predicted phosphoesterase